MGVHKLRELIERYAPNAIKTSSLEKYNNDNIIMLGTDASMQLYRFLTATINSKNEGIKRKDGKNISHIIGVIRMTNMMIKNNMIPIWVFDGNSPDIKQETIERRVKAKHDASKKLIYAESISEIASLRKQSLKISDEQIKDVKYLLYLLGIPFIQSIGEADSQLVALTKSNIAQGIITNDWDILPFGGSNMLKDFSAKNITHINLDELLTSLKLTQLQFIEICNILGNDYCYGIPGYGPIEAYQRYVDANYDIEKLLQNVRDPDFNKEDFLNKFNAAREYYISAPVINPKQLDIKWNEPLYETLSQYLKENDLSDQEIFNITKTIKYLYQKYLIYS